jgi:hypothetical protein
MVYYSAQMLHVGENSTVAATRYVNEFCLGDLVHTTYLCVRRCLCSLTSIIVALYEGERSLIRH